MSETMLIIGLAAVPVTLAAFWSASLSRRRSVRLARRRKREAHYKLNARPADKAVD